MGREQFHSLRSIFLVAAVLLFVGAPGALAQQAGLGASFDRSFDERAANGLDDPEVSSLLAQRIVDILRADQDLLNDIRQITISQLRQRGEVISETDVADSVLFDRIHRDSAFRMAVATELERRGYLELDEFRDMAQQLAEERITQSYEMDEGDEYADTGQESARRLGTRRLPSRRVPSGMGEEDQTVRDRGREQPPMGREGEEAAESTLRRPELIRPEDRLPRPRRRPLILHKANPYPGLPSLRDLYAQIPSRTPQLDRFGEEVFRNGTGNYDQLPMDIPVGPDYVIGPGDGLTVNLWGSINQRLRRVVDRQGRLALPEVGPVLVAGRSLADAQKDIEAILAVQFRQVAADISLNRLRTVRVYVVGDVEQPGPYDVSSLSTALNAIYMAGGPTENGSMRKVRHYRGDKLIREIDLYDLILNGIRSEVDLLEAGDTILVPPVGPQVTVDGMVRRPAIYEINGEPSLAHLLELAGGVLPAGTMRQIKVERVEAHQRRVMLDVNLPDTQDPALLDKSLGDFQVQDGDYVHISPILPYSQQTVYLDGHVLRPGKYPYHDHMRVAELLRSYQDLMPEPAERAEVVRLEPPYFRPVVIPFDLARNVGADKQGMVLEPFDTVRIYGRYEMDPPTVAIHGEVLRPGEYPLSDGMTVAELVRMAGGFKRSAWTERADLASYLVGQDGQIKGENLEIDLARAMAGDAHQNLTLKPGDVLTIRQLAGWKEIGTSVTIEGEVLYPGTYGIQDGERLSSVLKRAGGFRENAYPAGAVLERVQVRQLAERSKRELIRRIQSAEIKPASSEQNQAALMQAFLQQRQTAVERLKGTPASGRQVISISRNLSEWENTPADIQLSAADVLRIPKKPNFVLVQGQVHSPSAITFVPGKRAGWYLKRAGGPTELANEKEVFIVRADGSVVGEGGDGIGWWKGDVLDVRLEPGDTIVVPEKVLSGSSLWRNLVQAAQVTSSIAIAARVATSF